MLAATTMKPLPVIDTSKYSGKCFSQDVYGGGKNFRVRRKSPRSASRPALCSSCFTPKTRAPIFRRAWYAKNSDGSQTTLRQPEVVLRMTYTVRKYDLRKPSNEPQVVLNQSVCPASDRPQGIQKRAHYDESSTF